LLPFVSSFSNLSEKPFFGTDLLTVPKADPNGFAAKGDQLECYSSPSASGRWRAT
jgi:hypothetical protein